MPSSATPGSSTSISSRQRCRHRPSPKEQRLGTPKIPAIRFTRGEDFEASTVHTFATACRFARHPVRIWPVSQPTAPFTSKLSTGQSPFPLLDMTTASTGLLVWGFFCQGVLAGRRIFFFVSFFVRSEGPFLRPDPHFTHVGARRSCQGWPSRHPRGILPPCQATP